MLSAWEAPALERLDAALARVGRPRTGPVQVHRAWGRSCTQTTTTEAGTLWIKHDYGLPPGEPVVLAELAQRWPGRVPKVVATYEGAVVMEQLPGSELQPDAPVEVWVQTAAALAELLAGEAARVPHWLALGVRDRRAPAWRPAVEQLLESPVLARLSAEERRQLDGLVPDFIGRYEDGFASVPCLIHQDSGCCNIHIDERGPVFFDWSDVVVGHPTFSCDRLLDQVPREHHQAVIDAFLVPLDLGLEEFRAMRRSNVLHEVLRYHDELGYLDEQDKAHVNLSKSVVAQLRVLMRHEASQA